MSNACFLPDLAFSIIGETKYQNIDFATKKLFKKNILKLKRLQTWIITRGFNSSVSEIIGDAINQDLNENSLNFFGITSACTLPFNLNNHLPNQVCFFNLNSSHHQFILSYSS